MQLELVTIGTELLLGHTIDTNAAWIGQSLSSLGIRLTRRTTVGDDEHGIQDAVRAALDRASAVVTTGGLGPTRDDITKRAIARAMGADLTFSVAVWDELVARYAKLGRALSDANRSQAEVPEGAIVLPNPRGTAPGIWWETPGGLVVMLPGVPREMRGLMREEVLPRLTKRGAGTTVTRSRTIRTAGIPESNLAARIGPIEESLAPLTLAYLPDVTGVDLRLTAWELPEAEAEERLERAAADLEHRIVPHAYGRDETDLAARLLEGLRRHRWRLAVAESCTGGLLAGRITAVPGCSDVFVGGLVLYDDAAKRELAGVPSLLLESAGAVSEGVVRELVEAAARNFRAEAAVGITGIAGPTGGSDEKPVGTVWFGFKLGDRIWTEHVVFPGNRAEIRARSAQHALYALWRHLPD